MSSYVTRKTPGDTSWFVHDRFGMFIHFGLYAIPARHEWIKSRERIPEDVYDTYFKYFNPDMFDAKAWAKQAKEAGMKYAVLTAKHHEGFCLFDSKYTEYKITNTPFGRDLVREYADAFRAEGLKVGLYYSLIDWHHPDYPLDRFHPRRDDPDAMEIDAGRDMTKYAKYMRDQVTELLTNYGDIDILWTDFSYTYEDPGYAHFQFAGGKGKDQWEAEELIKTIRSIRPGIILNNRTEIDQDIWTPEQVQPTEWVRDEKTGELLVWEACQTFSGSWGYFRDEQTWKSPKMLIDMLVNMVALGGNLLMNVGPTARGCFDYRAQNALQVYAEWMKFNSRSIYGCTMAEPGFGVPDGIKLTQSEDGSRLYLHLQIYPFKKFPVTGFDDRIAHAQFLHDGSEIRRVTDKGQLYFMLPPVSPNVISPVIEVFLK